MFAMVDEFKKKTTACYIFRHTCMHSTEVVVVAVEVVVGCIGTEKLHRLYRAEIRNAKDTFKDDIQIVLNLSTSMVLKRCMYVILSIFNTA